MKYLPSYVFMSQARDPQITLGSERNEEEEDMMKDLDSRNSSNKRESREKMTPSVDDCFLLLFW